MGQTLAITTAAVGLCLVSGNLGCKVAALNVMYVNNKTLTKTESEKEKI